MLSKNQIGGFRVTSGPAAGNIYGDGDAQLVVDWSYNKIDFKFDTVSDWRTIDITLDDTNLNINNINTVLFGQMKQLFFV